MEVRMLQGDLVVMRDDGRKVLNETAPIQPRIRNLVCVLALKDCFTASELKHLIWRPGECNDQTSALTSLIHNARRVLPPGRLVTSPAGRGPRRYSLSRHEGDMIDVDCFLAALDHAQRSRANGELERSARYYAQALSLWPASASPVGPLTDFPKTRFMLKHRDRLLARRREAAEEHAETQLRLGRHTTRLADEILQSIRTDPTNTRLWSLHILALYRAGYRGDALRAHETVRALFEAEFQAGPGTGMDQLQAQVLTDDPLLWTDAVLEDSIPKGPIVVASSMLAAAPNRSLRETTRPYGRLNRDVAACARERADSTGHAVSSITHRSSVHF